MVYNDIITHIEKNLGIGYGIMVPIAMTTFNNYFVKRRSALMCISSIFIGVGFVICPYLIKHLNDRYGLTGTLIILCGLGFHTFFAMAIMQPAEWHLKPINTNMQELTTGFHNFSILYVSKF